MRRLIYSPKVQAWINGTEGVVDISPYIVSGQVNRKINQVSTASLVLRNPVNQSGDYVGTLFTEFPRADGTTGPLFHPMDPIIITMQRLEGHPVQVFTGYLDKSPYLQLYPGLCQIEASCTLKRLQYTQFDAALPFVQNFLSLFGWVPDGNSGIMNPTTEQDKLKVFAGQIQNQFNDGSIGSLIYAILLYIAQWDSSTIFIEELPPQIKSYVVGLFTRIQADVNQDETIFQSLIHQILGAGSQGGGGGTGNGTASGPVAGAGQIVKTVAPIASQYGVPPELVLAVMYIETGFSDQDLPGNPHYGWFQCQISNPPYAHGTWSNVTPTIHQCHDLGLSCTAFCSAAAGWAKANPSLKNNLQQWAMSVQGVNGQNNPTYISGWPNAIATARSYLQRFGSGVTNTSSSAPTSFTPTGPGRQASSPGSGATANTTPSTSVSGTSPGGKSGRIGNEAQVSRYQVMVEAANTITAQNFPYVWGGGHGSPGVPTGGGFDCSGVLSAVLFAAGLTTQSFDTNTEVNTLGRNLTSGIDHSPNAVNIFVRLANPDHTFMQIGGRYFGTWSNATSTAGGGGWLSDGNPSGYQAYHIPQNKLMEVTANALPAAAGGPGGSASTPGGGGGGTTSGTAEAFSSMINLPSVFAQGEAMVFTGKRSFIADSPLFPFIEQLCQASLRNFMSMPNGNFFAFFPDYFGLFGRNYYWEVRDIEIIDGRIDLSDDPLATHVAISGDVTQFHATVDVFDRLLTAGIFDIFDAFALGYVKAEDTLLNTNLTVSNPNNPQVGTRGANEALDFLKKYGARTYVEDVPAIRSPFFELFYSFMKFMLLWSKQFMTTFELTFMPELFPGGLVALPDHDLQLYVEEVVHSFDYTNGFTTTAHFSSPSKLNDQSRPNLREGLTRVSAGQFANVSNPLATTAIKKKKT